MSLPSTSYDRVTSSSAYTTQKAKSDARLASDKAVDDRRKNLLILIHDHLLSYGYLDSAERLSKESGMPLSAYTPADNVDLQAVLHDYESFFEMRFNRKPKLARKSGAHTATHTGSRYAATLGYHSATTSGGAGEALELSRANIPPSMARLANAAVGVAHAHSPGPGTGPGPRRPASASAAGGRVRHGDRSSEPVAVRPGQSPARDRDRSSAPAPAPAPAPVYVGSGSGSGSASASARDSPDASLTARKAPTHSHGHGDRDRDKGKLKPPILPGSGTSSHISPSLSGASDREKDGTGSSDLYDAPMLKPIPEAAFPGEFRDMAFTIQREIVVESPDVRWGDVKGLDDAKRVLKEAVVMPIKYPRLFSGILSPWKGLLLFGPPGTGKTLLAKAVASECNITFFNISASAIVSKWRGDSEKLVRVLFELARYQAPSCIFIDEIDSLMSARDQQAEHEGSRRLKTELLIQIDGLTRTDDQIFVLAASNLPWDLDHALLRRLEKRIYVPLPTEEARAEMLRHHLDSGTGTGTGSLRVGSAFDFDAHARELGGFSGSDIRILCKEAAMSPVRRLMDRLEAGEDVDVDEEGEMTLKDLGEITEGDWSAALSVTRPSTKSNTEQQYTAWMEKFGSV